MSLSSPSSSESNPWDTTTLEHYCDSVIGRVRGISVRISCEKELEEEDIVDKLRRADAIVKEARTRRLQEKLEAIEIDAAQLFSSDNIGDIVRSCKQLVQLIKLYNSNGQIQSGSSTDDTVIALDSPGREILEILIKNMDMLLSESFDSTDIKFSIDKLILDAKLQAMTAINKLNETEERYRSITEK